MSLANKTFTRFVGCDVGKTSISIFDSAGCHQQTVPNDAKSLRAVLRRLDAACLVICEATGGYENALLEACLERGIPAHRADARKVKAFIRSFGVLGKTDQLDAAALSRYGRERWQTLPLWQGCDPAQRQMQALSARRDELVAMRAAERNRVAGPQIAASKRVAASIKAIITALTQQIKSIEQSIAEVVAASEPLRQKVACMKTQDGVGIVVARQLCAAVPELGTMSGKQAAALTALAPHPHQSGQRDGYRKVRGGRPQVRRILFMAALAVTNCKSGVLKSFYDRLVARGKKKLVALTAVMRKMIVMLNAKLRDLLRPPAAEAAAT